MCLWAIDQKLASTDKKFIANTFAEFVYKELSDRVHSRSENDDSFYKHVVINTQSRTFEDPNYVDTIGSKVVTKPLSEVLERSVKKDQLLQRAMVVPKSEQASSSQDATGHLSSGEAPEASDAHATGYLPPNQMQQV